MFTAENFRRIYDLENRKGHDLAGRYFPNLDPLTENVRQKVQAVRHLKSSVATLPKEQFDEQLKALRDELAAVKSEKSAAVDAALAQVSARVEAPNFRITLSQKLGPKGKQVYCIDGTPETFFAVKQLQRNLFQLYGVKQADRHNLVCQVRDTLVGGFPYDLVRTDISTFYEAIDRKQLLELLDQDQLLSTASRKFLRQVLDSYGIITGSALGIPRGVGVSAYLAELYLRPVDKMIRKLPGLVMCGRYVDDIIAFFARSPAGDAPASYRDEIERILNRRGFNANPDKTKVRNLASIGPFKFEYLGYRFSVEGQSVKVSPSVAKVRKYLRRLSLTFECYYTDRSIRPRRAFRDLVARVRFLTGNTRLANSKSSALTGIYYNNAVVTDQRCFQALDRILRRKVRALRVASLRKRLQGCSFASGFDQRRFHNFSTYEMRMIVKAWKYG